MDTESLCRKVLLLSIEKKQHKRNLREMALVDVTLKSIRHDKPIAFISVLNNGISPQDVLVGLQIMLESGYTSTSKIEKEITCLLSK